ncbi:MAG: hypothetical protein OEY28_03665 [Nitrospira sp.]|nr:hypothetical protein [Nitrospira sp.]
MPRVAGGIFGWDAATRPTLRRDPMQEPGLDWPRNARAPAGSGAGPSKTSRAAIFDLVDLCGRYSIARSGE